MKTVVVVNNYNYVLFLPAALNSVLAQSHTVDEIIVIDDGSTDGSADWVREHYPSVRVVEKPNGGQMSAFNQIPDLVSAQDLVFFMDADDVYGPHHVATVVQHAKPDVDFYMLEALAFDRDEAWREALNGRAAFTPEQVSPLAIESSGCLATYAKAWIGVPTSGLCLRGRLLKRLLPFPHEADWRSRADDILVRGASILGARKMLLRGTAFGWRHHGSNSYAGTSMSAVDLHRYKLRTTALINYYRQVAHLPGPVYLYEVLREHTLLPPEALRYFSIESTFKILLRTVQSFFYWLWYWHRSVN